MSNNTRAKTMEYRGLGAERSERRGPAGGLHCLLREVLFA